jgi:hypothetical protein
MFLKRGEEIGEKGLEILEMRAECRVRHFLILFLVFHNILSYEGREIKPL